MMAILEVEVRIRKGFGPDYKIKNIPIGFDDLPDDTSNEEIKDMAKMEVDSLLRSSEDYPLYGKNWEIIDYHWA